MCQDLTEQVIQVCMQDVTGCCCVTFTWLSNIQGYGVQGAPGVSSILYEWHSSKLVQFKRVMLQGVQLPSALKRIVCRQICIVCKHALGCIMAPDAAM